MAKKILMTLLVACTLVGCVPAFIAGTALGGIVVYEGRTAHIKKQDFQLSQQIKKRINADQAIAENSRIIVSAYDGVILLAGQSPQAKLKQQAGNIAHSVTGVKRIYNEISLTKPISSLAQSKDTWITTKVKSVLLATKDLNSSQIKVVTENSVVYLLGKVTHSQAKIASDATRTVRGVKKVVTIFEYDR